jgi:hypothetical protein
MSGNPMKKQNLFRLILVALGLVIGLALVFHFYRQPHQPNDLGHSFYFHPDMVKRLVWTTGEFKTEFSRDSRRSSWEPEVDGSEIQEKLNLISTIAVQPMKPPRSPAIQLEVEFGANNSWKGAFDGENFVWISGNLKDQGVELDENLRKIFYGGRFAFIDRNFNWCPKRPKQIDFEIENVKFALAQEGLKWILTSGKGKRELDPTSVESWLGQNCSDRVQWFRDLKAFPLHFELQPSEFKMTFTDGSSTTYQIREGFFKVSNDLAIIPQRLASGLSTLSHLP